MMPKRNDVKAKTDLLWLHDPFRVEQTEFLVRGLLEPQGLAVLYGESGTGKSTLAVDLAFAIATGNPWRGCATSQGLVLHVAGEGSRGLRMRQAAYCLQYQIPRTAPYAVMPKAIALGADAELELVDCIAQASVDMRVSPRLVIVDTLARCMAGDENSGQDMGAFIKACDYIRECTGAAVLVIHHAGKDVARGARGHSSLRAAADTELLVEGWGNPRTLKVTKQRDIELIEPMVFDLEPVKLAVDETGTNVTACVVKHSDARPAPSKPSGKQQATLLAELERRYQAGEVAWTDSELRTIGRDLDMHKASARSASLGLHSAGYLVPSVGGSTLKYAPTGPQG